MTSNRSSRSPCRPRPRGSLRWATPVGVDSRGPARTRGSDPAPWMPTDDRTTIRRDGQQDAVPRSSGPKPDGCGRPDLVRAWPRLHPSPGLAGFRDLGAAPARRPRRPIWRGPRAHERTPVDPIRRPPCASPADDRVGAARGLKSLWHGTPPSVLHATESRSRHVPGPRRRRGASQPRQPHGAGWMGRSPSSTRVGEAANHPVSTPARGTPGITAIVGASRAPAPTGPRVRARPGIALGHIAAHTGTVTVVRSSPRRTRRTVAAGVVCRAGTKSDRHLSHQPEYPINGTAGSSVGRESHHRSLERQRHPRTMQSGAGPARSEQRTLRRHAVTPRVPVRAWTGEHQRPVLVRRRPGLLDGEAHEREAGRRPALRRRRARGPVTSIARPRSCSRPPPEGH